ncbi:hypothetical protein JHK85_030599 [Glycine max]|nr:hypothetical protein JHK85_030599 [Glycine max]
MALPSLSFLFIFSVSHSIPFIVIHGIGDQCSNRGVKKFTQQLSSFSGAEGYCNFYINFLSVYKEILFICFPQPLLTFYPLKVEPPVGNGSWDSWFKPLKEQVKQVKELKEGYNIVGLSQVKNFISLGGPHTGTASVPICGVSTIVAFQHGALGIFCVLADTLIKGEVYSSYIQAIPDYLENCRFLPVLNNEIPDKRNSTYKERFSSLQNLVLIMLEHDTVLIPRETSWFGYYPDGYFKPVLPPQSI